MIHRLRPLALVAGLSITACASPSMSAKEATVRPTREELIARLQPVKQWPLRFHMHSFSAKCYDTYACRVDYAGILQWNDAADTFRRSSASYGPNYNRNWSGIHGMIPNFPPPAVVTWRSSDGEAHRAEIDMGRLFGDQVIRHKVPREEMGETVDGMYNRTPAIILEVNDRTVRVWMRAHVPTKALQTPGNKYSNFRNDLILVDSRSY